MPKKQENYNTIYLIRSVSDTLAVTMTQFSPPNYQTSYHRLRKLCTCKQQQQCTVVNKEKKTIYL